MKATVFGKVQGVWFRDSTCTEAQNLNIFGWVKNMPDGTVMLEAEGEESGGSAKGILGQAADSEEASGGGG